MNILHDYIIKREKYCDIHMLRTRRTGTQSTNYHVTSSCREPKKTVLSVNIKAADAVQQRRCPAEITKFCLPYYIAKYHQIYNFIGCSSSNLILCQAVKKSKMPFVWKFDIFSRYFVCSFNISLLSSLWQFFYRISRQ